MIESLISSKTRIKLLLKFFLSEGTQGYLRGLETEFGDSSNAIRVELNRLVNAGLLASETVGNKRMFRANPAHPLYVNLREIVRKHVGLDRLIASVVEQLGSLEAMYLAGSFSQGLDSGVIDLVLVGDVDKVYLVRLIDRAEALVARKIRYVVYSGAEMRAGALAEFEPAPMLLWEKGPVSTSASV